MEEQKREQIKAYFKKFPSWTIWVVGIALVAMLTADGYVRYAIAPVAIALAVLKMVKASKKPTDDQMDTWLEEDVEALRRRALEKSGLDSSEQLREPVVIMGTRFRNTGGAEIGFRKGKDGRARFTPVDITVINFTEHQLLTFQCALDRMTGKPLSECVQEFFYNDVVSVSTQSESDSFRVGDLSASLLSMAPRLAKSAVNGILQINNAESFVLVTSGATKVRVVLNEPMFIESLGGGTVSTEFAEQAVQVVRKMLREKKAGALPMRTASI